MRHRTLPFFCVVAAVAVLATITVPDGRTPSASRIVSEAVSEPREPVGTARPVQGRLAPTADEAVAVDRSRQLALPDGSFTAALNGAVDPAPLGDYWGPFEWSPIIGITRSSAGVDWYEHADGSFSTTQMVMRQDLGRLAAMTRVAHPGPQPAATASR